MYVRHMRATCFSTYPTSLQFTTTEKIQVSPRSKRIEGVSSPGPGAPSQLMATLLFLRCLVRFFPCFFLSCKANARVNPQRRGTARTLPNFCVLCIFCVVLCIFVLFYVLFVLCRYLYCLCIDVY
jgi:hypothetical protein